MSCRAFSPERSRTGPNGSRDIFIHICIIDFSIRYAQSQSACRLSDSERNDNEVLFSQPLSYLHPSHDFVAGPVRPRHPNLPPDQKVKRFKSAVDIISYRTDFGGI